MKRRHAKKFYGNTDWRGATFREYRKIERINARKIANEAWNTGQVKMARSMRDWARNLSLANDPRRRIRKAVENVPNATVRFV